MKNLASHINEAFAVDNANESLQRQPSKIVVKKRLFFDEKNKKWVSAEIRRATTISAGKEYVYVKAINISKMLYSTDGDAEDNDEKMFTLHNIEELVKERAIQITK